ncbi:MAG: hypothetical protein E7256_09460 [Lachnospiraceae bacterium]|nr:hypothetical protein [Lachnospiraceae bacterium]
MRENMVTRDRMKRAWDYFGWGLYAFAGLGIDALVLMVLQQIYGKSFGEWETFEYCIHWSIVCLGWGCVVWLLKRAADRKYGENLLRQKEKFTRNGFLMSAALVIILVTAETMLWDGFKPVREFVRLGAVKFGFQYVYYFLEVLLVLLIVVFGQRCGECLTGKKRIPWGGIMLAFTWGLVHCLTKGMATGIEAFLTSFCYGTIYLGVNRNIPWSYALLAVAFLL